MPLQLYIHIIYIYVYIYIYSWSKSAFVSWTRSLCFTLVYGTCAVCQTKIVSPPRPKKNCGSRKTCFNWNCHNLGRGHSQISHGTSCWWNQHFWNLNPCLKSWIPTCSWLVPHFLGVKIHRGFEVSIGDAGARDMRRNPTPSVLVMA